MLATVLSIRSGGSGRITKFVFVMKFRQPHTRMSLFVCCPFGFLSSTPKWGCFFGYPFGVAWKENERDKHLFVQVVFFLRDKDLLEPMLETQRCTARSKFNAWTGFYTSTCLVKTTHMLFLVFSWTRQMAFTSLCLQTRDPSPQTKGKRWVSPGFRFTPSSDKSPDKTVPR